MCCRPWGTEGRGGRGGTDGTVVPLSAERLSSGRWWGIGAGVGEGSARRCGDNWVNTFRPFVPRIYIFQQGPRALCTRALGMRPHTCMRSGERERERERSGGATCARIGTYEFCGGWMVTWLNLLLENLNLCVGFFFFESCSVFLLLLLWIRK